MELRAFLLVVHLLSTLLMAAPFYMLVIVNERARFGAPLGYFTDRYMENIIRNNAVRCFIFQGTMLASGLWLTYITRGSFIPLFTEPTLIVKWVALVILASLLSHIHFSVQPQIERLMEQVKPDAPVPQGLAPQIAALRSRRKKLSGVCLFLVLTALIMGLRATFFYNLYLAIGLVAVAAVYAWRVYRKPVPLGWI
ncbi:MAG TPA: hypothetical protein G4O01_05665 [Dehalococcoidia bacterium]|nr:hypothetical protein [Dehalococcoidia bacterium]